MKIVRISDNLHFNYISIIL